MKLLGNMMVCGVSAMLLVACSQESLELAQRDISYAPEPASPSTAKANPNSSEPNPSEPKQPTEPILPAPPAKGMEVNPPKTEPTEPAPPTTEPGEPAEPEQTPEDIKNRKLISGDPQENLEVLNEALDAWLATHDELPEKIADLVMGEHLPMLPMAPPGERFEIDRVTKRIVLVANN